MIPVKFIVNAIIAVLAVTVIALTAFVYKYAGLISAVTISMACVGLALSVSLLFYYFKEREWNMIRLVHRAASDHEQTGKPYTWFIRQEEKKTRVFLYRDRDLVCSYSVDKFRDNEFSCVNGVDHTEAGDELIRGRIHDSGVSDFRGPL